MWYFYKTDQKFHLIWYLNEFFLLFFPPPECWIFFFIFFFCQWINKNKDFKSSNMIFLSYYPSLPTSQNEYFRAHTCVFTSSRTETWIKMRSASWKFHNAKISIWWSNGTSFILSSHYPFCTVVKLRSLKWLRKLKPTPVWAFGKCIPFAPLMV